MTVKKQIADKVTEIYKSIDMQIAEDKPRCRECGRCCDFDSFDHRLFVTSPEIIYFRLNMKENLKPALNGKCPYNVEGKCSVYHHRFAGCRVFFCEGDKDSQNELTESAIKGFKSICEDFNIPYRYMDLGTALSYQPK